MPTSTARTARQTAVRDQVLAGVAELLTGGAPLTYANVAEASGVPERTVYRHFPSREELMTAVVGWINERAGTDRPTTGAEAREVIRHQFGRVDEVAPVVRTLLVSPEGLVARLHDNEDRRAAALALVDHEAPGLDPVPRLQVAATVQLLTSAAAWQSLRDYWDMDGAAAAATVATTLDLLLDGARRHAGSEEDRRGGTTLAAPGGGAAR